MLLYNKMDTLPEEIQSKIYFLAHPKIKRNIKSELQQVKTHVMCYNYSLFRQKKVFEYWCNNNNLNIPQSKIDLINVIDSQNYFTPEQLDFVIYNCKKCNCKIITENNNHFINKMYRKHSNYSTTTLCPCTNYITML